MFGAAAKHLTPSGHSAFFMPTSTSQVQLANAVKGIYIQYRENIGPEHFKNGGLLLLQHETGAYQWTFLESLFKQDHNIRLYKCSLSNKEADYIVKDRILFICNDDSRLSDFSLLSKAKSPPSCDDAAESIDLVSRHLASKRAVVIYHVDEMGNKTINETNTADYYRAKVDIRRHPENTRNMRRFCNRQGPTGEGPSDLQSRICFGYVKPIKYPSKLTPPFNFSCQLSTCKSNDSNDNDDDSDTLPCETDDPHHSNDDPPTRTYRKHSTLYYLLRLTLCSPTRLSAEQHRHDLVHARKEKKPERRVVVLLPSTMTTVPAPKNTRRAAHWAFVKRVSDFCVRSCGGGGSGGSGGKEAKKGVEAKKEGVEEKKKGVEEQRIGGGDVGGGEKVKVEEEEWVFGGEKEEEDF